MKLKTSKGKGGRRMLDATVAGTQLPFKLYACSLKSGCSARLIQKIKP